jgi:hypothetical protein
MRSGRRGYDVALLTVAEPGRRNRRTIDGLLLGLTALGAAAAAVIARSAPAEDEAVADSMETVLGWAEGFWRGVVIVFLLLGLAIVLDCFVRGRWDLARDVVVALVVLAGIGSVLGQVVGPDWLAVDDDLWTRWGFPEYRLAVVTAVAAVVGPELVVPVRRLLYWLIGSRGGRTRRRLGGTSVGRPGCARPRTHVRCTGETDLRIGCRHPTV